MSFTFTKLRSLLPGNQSNANNDNSRRHTMILEPEIGFQLILGTGTNTTTTSARKSYETDKQIPELNVNLVAARHLPSMFGFKTVQGYVVKVKLFPGTLKFDSTIQTSTWPKFNETFKFPLQPELKSSVKNYTKEKLIYEDLPSRLFCGHFVVFTMYALLELPSGHFNRFRGTYRSLREKSTSLIQKISDGNNENTNPEEKPVKSDENSALQLTKSESRRNIGSVTCYLESKLFKKNPKTEQFESEEIWLPIKDLTTTATTNLSTRTNSVGAAKKGQVEIILELCDSELDDEKIYKEIDSTKLKNTKQKLKSHYSDLKRLIKSGKSSQSTTKIQYLKVTTSKMRSSIKVKDDFEENAGLIYIKTTVYSMNTLLDSWKCDNFLPSISIRWDPNASTLIIPLGINENLSEISIKTTVATKNKMGKKIVLGTVLIGAMDVTSSSSTTVQQSTTHWQTAVDMKNQPIAMWHNFQ